jgi:Na+/melibiose symporter-like transporter
MKRKRSFLLYVLIFLSLEKFVQHMFVTYAFYVDLAGIRSKVAIDYSILMIAGFFVGVLFLVNLFFLWQGKRFSLVGLFVLALVDFVGEFVAQGTLAIVITVSFVVATTILLILLFKRNVLGDEPGGENDTNSPERFTKSVYSVRGSK